MIGPVRMIRKQFGVVGHLFLLCPKTGLRVSPFPQAAAWPFFPEQTVFPPLFLLALLLPRIGFVNCLRQAPSPPPLRFDFSESSRRRAPVPVLRSRHSFFLVGSSLAGRFPARHLPLFLPACEVPPPARAFPFSSRGPPRPFFFPS